jgi:hypothetical protein
MSSSTTFNLKALRSIVSKANWKRVVKLFKREEVVTSDWAFRFGTNYTSGFIFLLICLSFGNQAFRSAEIACQTMETSGESGDSGDKWPSNPQDNRLITKNPVKELNDFCWDYGTFLVVKGLDPAVRSEGVIFPGIVPYDEVEDELLWQGYYKRLWLGFGIILIIATAPKFFWKVKLGTIHHSFHQFVGRTIVVGLLL